jgi:glutamyl-tRNA synthetase
MGPSVNPAHLALPGAGRFAPTPTGRLHIGNARTALLAWLSARKAGLRNLLRVEDLDPAAMPSGCLEEQFLDLDWLGLVYDECPRIGGPVGPYRQSERYDAYEETLTALNELGLLYPCWCSRKEVRLASLAPHASDEGPVYHGACRPTQSRPIEDLANLPERRDRSPSLRINVREAMKRLGLPTIAFHDLVAGPQNFHIIDRMGDFVVRRVDGVAAYQIACAWDDVAMNCTQILRGVDLLPSTARQLLILKVLGLPEPQYAHVGLVVDSSGERLAKRSGGLAISVYRESEQPSRTVIHMLAALSGLPETANLDLLTEAVEISTLSPNPVRLREEMTKNG